MHKVQLKQELHSTDRSQHITLVNWFLEHDGGFLHKINFSDEADLSLRGFVNKIVAYGDKKIHKLGQKNLHISKNILFDLVFGLVD